MSDSFHFIILQILLHFVCVLIFQEPVMPLIEPHIKEDRFKHSPGRGGFMNQPIRQLHNPKEDYRMWQPHKERNSRYHWEKPNLSTQPRLPLVRTLLERHHKDMVSDMW